MVTKIDGAATMESLKKTLDRIQKDRFKRKRPNLSEFFGVLPNIADGLEFQKRVRNEWE